MAMMRGPRMRRCKHCKRPVQQTVLRTGYCKACISLQREEYAAIRAMARDMGVEVNDETRSVLAELVRVDGGA